MCASSRASAAICLSDYSPLIYALHFSQLNFMLFFPALVSSLCGDFSINARASLLLQLLPIQYQLQISFIFPLLPSIRSLITGPRAGPMGPGRHLLPAACGGVSWEAVSPRSNSLCYSLSAVCLPSHGEGWLLGCGVVMLRAPGPTFKLGESSQVQPLPLLGIPPSL